MSGLRSERLGRLERVGRVEGVGRLALLLLLLAAGCGGDTATDPPAGPGTGPGRRIAVPEEFPTIGEALTSARSGDTVVVACGLYEEHGLELKPRVQLTSATGLPDCVTIDARGRGGVLRCFSGDTLTRVAGFTLRGGKASLGGGLWLDHAPILVEDCVFEADTSTSVIGGGGGVYGYRCDARLLRCTFRGNVASRAGGGAFFEISAPQFEDCRFVSNASDRGGAAAFFTSSEPLLTGCAFDSNRASGPNGGEGGAVIAIDSELVLSGCGFDHNESASAGGAVYASGADAAIAHSEFVWNRAGTEAGAVHIAGGDAEIDTCRFSLNRAQTGGAASVAVTAGAFFTGCTFDANGATIAGGALWCAGEAVVAASTFFENLAATGGSVYLDSGGILEIDRSILAATVIGGAIGCADATPRLECCDLWGNAGGDYVGCVEVWADSLSNISADPLFCDPETGEFRIQESSPCAPGASPGCGLIGAWPPGCGERPRRNRLP